MEATTMRMMKCSEVAERLGISRTSAYEVIRELNQELSENGLATPIWTFFSETEACLPEFDRAHVA